MTLSYEEALYYKLLLQSGFTKETNEWINKIMYTSETLDGIYLDLVCNQNNLNNLISCLHNYIIDKEIDEKVVYEKLRLFIKNKLENNEISLEEAVNYFTSFAIQSENMYNPPWNNFYSISLLYDYLLEGFLNKDEFIKILNDFIETGKEINSNILSFNSNTKPQKNNKVLLLIIIFILFSLITIIILSI